MTRTGVEAAEAVEPSNIRLTHVDRGDRVSGDPGSRIGDQSWQMSLRPEEKELLRDLIHDLRTIRYGSILLVIHEGRLVEMSRTVRIRKGNTPERQKGAP